MKKVGHPKWYPETQVSCACGNVFTVGSTLEGLRIDICAKCHPFYTGEMKYIDALGRVDRFKQKREKADKIKVKIAQVKEKELQRARDRALEPKTLKEMLHGLK